MRGKGTSAGRSQPRTRSETKSLKRCKNIGKADNVIFIDVDGDNIDDVIIIDGPDSLPHKQGSSLPRDSKECSLETIICIDDDESADSNNLGIGVQGADNVHSDGSSSSRPCPDSDHSRNSSHADGDECPFVQENVSPIKISKCKRTYSGKASTRNHYGLSPEPQSCSFDNDSPDSEFMEGSSGKLQEQWERASLKRKHGVCSGESDKQDQAGAYRSQTDTCQNVGVENMTEQHPKGPVCSTSSNARYEKAAHEFTDEGSFGYLPEHGKRNFRKGHSGTRNHGSVLRFHFDAQQNVEVEKMPDSKTKGPGCSSSTSHPNTANDCNLGSTSNGPSNVNTDFDFNSTEATRFSRRKADVRDRGESLTTDPPSNYAGEQPCRHFKHGVNCFCNEEKQCPQGTFCSTLEQDNEKVNNAKAFPCTKSPRAKAHVSNSEPRVDINFGHIKARVPMCDSQQPDMVDNSMSTENGDVTSTVDSCLISEREKLKETDEYKRAIEEEWASRQCQLKIQAEEAQHLRRLQKRKRAESMRLLDMERRQKERVEEIRLAQKKVEENMNLKEKLRAEVRKELNLLEVTSRDMASLLRGLGINVSGGLQPSPTEIPFCRFYVSRCKYHYEFGETALDSQEITVPRQYNHKVHAAYKRACLRYHPDRTNGCDVRQLVEAEEKFKLISRMKDKFSCS